MSEYFDELSVKKRINSINFDIIIHKMIFINGWRAKHAIALCDQYKNFLYLKKKYGDKYELPPSDEIDEFWHEHIIHTKKYMNDCKVIFNKYLHHHPGAPWENQNIEMKHYYELFNHTQELYKKEFGDYIYMIRPYSIARLFKTLKLKWSERQFTHPLV